MRRGLHQIPELCGKEIETQGYICAFLEERGIPCRKILTGVVADFRGKDTSKTIAFRADIDGLPITEKANLPFASQNGNMHACGHDGHVAILLTFCDILAESKPPVNVRTIFQFGEEGALGAEQMIAGGALDGVSEIYALHLDPALAVGKFASASGAMMAGAVELRVRFFGKEAHCAEAEKGVDALKPLAALIGGRWAKDGGQLPENKKNAGSSQLSTSLHFRPPATGRQRSTLFHVGKISGGTAHNIVAGLSEAFCTLRYFLDYETHLSSIELFLRQADAEFGTAHELLIDALCPPLDNAVSALARVRLAVPDLLLAAPRYTAEDFACYLTKIPGCLTWLGVKDETFFAPLHSDTFGFSEGALLYGVEMYIRILEQFS